MDEDSQNNETMEKPVFQDMLLRLGFVDAKYLEKIELKSENVASTPGENLVQRIWKNLGGEIRSHVTLNNVRIFLLAVMGTFTEPGLAKAEQNLIKVDENEYGHFNDFGDLFLDALEIPRIQKCYHQLYTQRMGYEGVQQKLRRTEKARVREFEFQPKVNDSSKDIALRYREKVEHQQQSKLSQIEWLMQPSKSPQWSDAAKKLLEMEEMRNCTFKPKIRQFKSPQPPKKEEGGRSSKSPINNESLQQQPLIATTSSPMNINNEQASSLMGSDNNKAASKLRSIDYMPQTGNKCKDLF